MSVIYKHYGAEKFNKDMVDQAFKSAIQINSYKPMGLWACRKDSEYDWSDYLLNEGDGLEDKVNSLDKFFYFKLKNSAKILNIYKPEDIADFVAFDDRYPDDYFMCHLDWNKLKQYYDGMEVFMEQNFCNLHNSIIFYSYDIDSICVWNSNIIIPLSRKEVFD